MKILARILLILAAAGAVVGVSMALVGTQGARAAGPRGEPPAQVQAGDANAQPGSAGEQRHGGPGGFERDERGPSIFGIGEMLKDLIIIALIVAVAAPLARMLGRMRSGSQPNAGPPSVAPPA